MKPTISTSMIFRLNNNIVMIGMIMIMNLIMIQLDFDQLDYENYDYAGIGVLNFNKAPPSPSRRPNRRRPSAKISKRFLFTFVTWMRSYYLRTAHFRIFEF